MSRSVLLSLLALAACGREQAAGDNRAAAVAETSPPPVEGDVAAAERLVRERLGNAQGVAFANPRRRASEGVAIVCGDYRQGDVRHRYIVVGGEEVFVEPQMGPGEMDLAFREFCGEGAHG